MRVPLDLTCVNVARTDALEEIVRKEASKLDRICPHMISCRVGVERPQSHQRTGSPYRVRINVRVPPGHDLVSRREAGEGSLHDDLATVVREAFAAMQRQLRDLTEKQRGHVKAHARPRDQEVLEGPTVQEQGGVATP